MLPVYADLWLHTSAPLEAVNHALEEALDDLLVPPALSGNWQKPKRRRLVFSVPASSLGMSRSACLCRSPRPCGWTRSSLGWPGSTRTGLCRCLTRFKPLARQQRGCP